MVEPIKHKALYILPDWAMARIYSAEQQSQLSEMVDFVAAPQTPRTILENPSLLADVEVIFSGWGGPKLDTAFLNAATNLRGFFYGAGATAGMLSPEVWERGITVTSAAAINAIPVAEFTFASIIFALKNALPFMRGIAQEKAFPKGKHSVLGAYRRTVGLVSLGAIGRLVCERLRTMDLDVVVYDPYLSESDFFALGSKPVSLDDIFALSDVVSVHTPWLPDTERMIRGTHIAAMRSGTTLINTARGAVIDEGEMIAVLTERADLTAILDVTYPEPPVPGSPLYTLPNVFLTPHIAGSMGQECFRMGQFIVDEYERFVRGEPLHGAIHPEATKHTSHQMPT